MKTAYYTGEGGKVPALIIEKKRVWATVYLLNEGSTNQWESWEVPIEDLIETNDFFIAPLSNAVTGNVLLWRKK